MPLYEYRCNNCKSKYSILVRSLSATPEPVCTSCGSTDAERLFSTFARIKTDNDVYDEILNDNTLVDRMMHNDPSAMLEWSRKMEGTEAEKTPEFEEVIERMERGEDLQSLVREKQKELMAAPEDESPLDSSLDE